MTTHCKKTLSFVITLGLFLSLAACDSDLEKSTITKKSSKDTTVKIEGMTKQTEGEELAPLFIPSLSAILLAAEKEKGSPLNKEDVLNIRDNSTTIMTPKSMIKSMAKKRGYEDIDPENCWNEWQLLRKSLNTENEGTNDHDAVVIDNPSDNPAMRNAEGKARETLDQFRQIIKKYLDINPMIKIRIEDTNATSRMWLFVDKVESNGFKAHLFEVPSDFEKYQAGDSFTVKDTDILDWMINNSGKVYGAYTIRVQRESMSEKEGKEMDEYMGIDKYL